MAKLSVRNQTGQRRQNSEKVKNHRKRSPMIFFKEKTPTPSFTSSALMTVGILWPSHKWFNLDLRRPHLPSKASQFNTYYLELPSIRSNSQDPFEGTLRSEPLFGHSWDRDPVPSPLLGPVMTGKMNRFFKQGTRSLTETVHRFDQPV